MPVQCEPFLFWAQSKNIKKESLARRSRAWPGPGFGDRFGPFLRFQKISGLYVFEMGGGVDRAALCWYGPFDLC